MHTLISPFKVHRKWVIFAAILFFSSLIGAKIATYLFYAEMVEIFTPLFQELQVLGETVFNEQSPLTGTLFLFRNNITASLVMMLSGPLIVIPFLALILNGGGVGVLGAMFFMEGLITPFHFYVRGILPHGIFEIPALLLSGAIGIRIAVELLRPPTGSERWQNLRTNYSRALTALPTIIFLLGIAALVEVFLTPMLLMM